jgi:hypothetical protein
MSSSDYKLVPVSKLMKLVEEGRKVSETVASHTGTWREKIADAVENHRLHKQAFAVAQKAYRLLHKDELKGKEFVAQTRAYLDMIEDNFQGHQGDLAQRAGAGKKGEVANGNGKDAEGGDKDETEAQVESNVRALRGIKPKPSAAAAEAGKPDVADDNAVH